MALIQISNRHIVKADSIDVIEFIQTKNDTLFKVIIDGQKYNVEGDKLQKNKVFEDILKAVGGDKATKQFASI